MRLARFLPGINENCQRAILLGRELTALRRIDRPLRFLPSCRYFGYAPTPSQQSGRTHGESFLRPLIRYGVHNGDGGSPMRPQDPDEAEVLQDEKIQAFKVHIVQADGKLGEPVILQDALEGRKKDEKGRCLERLRQVRKPDAKIIWPICKYYNIKEEREKELAQKKASRLNRTAKTQSKQIELSWTIGDNDLGHRMEAMKGFLTKGKRVEVVVGSARKRGWRKKRLENAQMAQSLVLKIKSAALEAGGNQDGQEKGSLDERIELCFEPPKQSNNS